jgi:hypothetical protein
MATSPQLLPAERTQRLHYLYVTQPRRNDNRGVTAFVRNMPNCAILAGTDQGPARRSARVARMITAVTSAHVTMADVRPIIDGCNLPDA